MSEEANDQITKEPETPIVKQKDPKKVAAGKKLAEYKRNAKKEAAPSNNEESHDGSWAPQLSVTTALTVIGIGLTAADLYLRWRKDPVEPVRRSPVVAAAAVVVPHSGME